MSLVDQHNRSHNYLRISVTEKCNFRCTYCMPEKGIPLLPKSHLMTKDEIIQIAQYFVDKGVNKIRITGGEPLVRKDLPEILKELAQLNIELAITSNGVLIDQYIQLFKEIGLKKINISLDTLNAEKNFKITRRKDFEKVVSNINLLLKEGFELKINAVLMKGTNDDELIDFIEQTKEQAINIRFIEFMPFNGNDWEMSKTLDYETALTSIKSHYPNIVKLKDGNNDTTKHFQVEGYKGRFGFISTVSEPFCDTCNRLRLTADGKMKNCLFSNQEADLLSALRKGEKLDKMVNLLLHKKEAYRAGMKNPVQFAQRERHEQNRAMIAIGG